MKKRGFTLIEIAVVVLVIAILAAAALPQYRKSLERSRAAEAFDILTEIRNKQEARDLLGTGTAKGYTVKFSDLGEVIAGKNSTTNTLDTSLFTYTLSNNPYPQAYAKRKDMDYSIVQTKGYQDSALCCLGRDCKVVDSVLKGCEKTACLTTCATGYKKTGYFFSEDGPCCEAKTSCPTTCPAGQQRTSAQYSEDGACCVSKTSCPATCPTGQKRTSVQYYEDGACCTGKTACPTTCPTGQQRTSVQYSEDGACCVTKTACPATCPTGQERTSMQYSEDGACCQSKSCGSGQTLVGGVCKTACPATCPSGQERTSSGYSEDGVCCQTKTCTTGQTLVNGVCKTACPATCPSGQERTSSGYSEDGACCKTKSCPSGQYLTNGICCLNAQVSKDGKTCIYLYKPEVIKVGILVDCHNNYSFVDKKKTQCYRTGAPRYFEGGKLPYVAAGGGCTAHYSYYNGGNWWEGGIAHGTPSDCNNSISDQQACDNNCKGATCSFKCIKTKSYGDRCGTYKCSNGMHCDNAEGSGTMLRCVRK
ncbi:Type II secretion system subunit [Elusimicrobium minutum Pei191]|uniref:Type II secretion system subunit n=1 Tax=Elusimicrobium minutum (strain Pei191) TaxID=445932 RepID=B2KCH0_ELUMP|nr:prepilin-type N-terminal cleavage/methylation domain-containing protein [Elusimicrobium minutum]ACC98091.1 Type II secretion system subunit [Elusimicrobium minutum Pei191]